MTEVTRIVTGEKLKIDKIYLLKFLICDGNLKSVSDFPKPLLECVVPLMCTSVTKLSIT